MLGQVDSLGRVLVTRKQGISLERDLASPARLGARPEPAVSQRDRGVTCDTAVCGRSAAAAVAATTTRHHPRHATRFDGAAVGRIAVVTVPNRSVSGSNRSRNRVAATSRPRRSARCLPVTLARRCGRVTATRPCRCRWPPSPRHRHSRPSPPSRPDPEAESILEAGHRATGRLSRPYPTAKTPDRKTDSTGCRGTVVVRSRSAHTAHCHSALPLTPPPLPHCSSGPSIAEDVFTETFLFAHHNRSRVDGNRCCGCPCVLLFEFE